MSVSSWFSKMIGTELTASNLEQVLIMQLRDLASAEDQLIEALPKMADAAFNPDLRSAFTTHLMETQLQRARLDEIFRLLDVDSETDLCEAMQGLIAEGHQIINLTGNPEAKDAALIAAAQRIEHYEIAGYGCARTFAHQLGHRDVALLLQDSLDEKAIADKILTHVAESHVNADAI